MSTKTSGTCNYCRDGVSAAHPSCTCGYAYGQLRKDRAATTYWYTVVASVNAAHGTTVREFEVEATNADEARLMIERELAGTWEWDEIRATEQAGVTDVVR